MQRISTPARVLRSVLCQALLLAPLAAIAGAQDLFEEVEHGFAENDGVRIHYVKHDTNALDDPDKAPLIVMIHGFPDFWYTWREQMPALADTHVVVAMDMRGYNKSDSPKGVENYAMPLLVADVVAVIRANGRKKAVVVGHDWGALVAWQVAITAPESVAQLVILSVPHPACFGEYVRTNDEQRAASQYARNFQRPNSHKVLSAAGLAFWVRDKTARPRYVAAFELSSFDGMMNYYRANYPDSSTLGSDDAQAAEASAAPRAYAPITCPVLVIHGRRDAYLLAGGHSGTWDHVDAELTILMLPEVGHFIQAEVPDRVTETIVNWLSR